MRRCLMTGGSCVMMLAGRMLLCRSSHNGTSLSLTVFVLPKFSIGGR
jgi:hypothetical protein